ncbi:MAG: DEAD/DEAH box helicase, partial [Ilumatobacteraceae bacterium]
MTTSTPSSRGARRRDNGHRSTPIHRPRVNEPAIATSRPAVPSPLPVPAVDYVTDFVALGVPAPLINVLTERGVT